MHDLTILTCCTTILGGIPDDCPARLQWRGWLLYTHYNIIHLKGWENWVGLTLFAWWLPCATCPRACTCSHHSITLFNYIKFHYICSIINTYIWWLHAAYKGEELRLQKLLPLWPPCMAALYKAGLWYSPCCAGHVRWDVPNGVLGHCPSLKGIPIPSWIILFKFAFFLLSVQFFLLVCWLLVTH